MKVGTNTARKMGNEPKIRRTSYPQAEANDMEMVGPPGVWWDVLETNGSSSLPKGTETEWLGYVGVPSSSYSTRFFTVYDALFFQGIYEEVQLQE